MFDSLVLPGTLTKSERKKREKRDLLRSREMYLQKIKFGPEQSLLKLYREGKIKKSLINHIPIGRVDPTIRKKYTGGLKWKN